MFVRVWYAHCKLTKASFKPVSLWASLIINIWPNAFAEHKQITKIMCKSEENISHATCPSIAWKVIQQNIVWHLRGNNRLHSNYI